jgi:hypothetical protein
MVRGFQVAGLLVSLMCFAAIAHSQAAQPAATVGFTLDFPGSQPGHYSISVASDGKSHYESSGRTVSVSEESEGSDGNDRFDYEFTVSPATRERIFDLARKTGYFQKDVDSHRKNLAFTGKKTLSYKDMSRSGESTYNYSPDPAVQELTSLFQGLSATLELGHRLEFSLRYQKLALADELKRTEESARMSPPIEIQAIAPILQQIVADSSVMNVTRARAQRLLDGPTGQRNR